MRNFLILLLWFSLKNVELSAESATISDQQFQTNVDQNSTEIDGTTQPMDRNFTQTSTSTVEPQTMTTLITSSTFLQDKLANQRHETEQMNKITRLEAISSANNTTTAHPNIHNASHDCPSFDHVDHVTQTHFSDILTHQCRFDRIQRPRIHKQGRTSEPVTVYTRAYVYFLQNLHAYDLQFKIQALLQLRYKDDRLEFKGVGSQRTTPIVGEEALRKKLWVPHIFFANEKDSGILGTYEKDILTTVSPDGTVIISTRFQATLFCSMDLRKFPFDQQQCRTVIQSWTYNSSDLKLEWETENAVTMGPDQHLTEYALINFFTNDTMIEANFAAFTGKYSSLSFTVTLKREIGFYMYDYYLPSMMIIAISWASFWLQADQTAPRIMLGTTTMLTFITLASAQDKSLPKVSYIKASEIWSMGCTAFIFMSLVEFAFVNTIWRRKDHAMLKKATASHILKHTFNIKSRDKDDSGSSSPRNLQKSNSGNNIAVNNNEVPSPRFYVGNTPITNAVAPTPTANVNDLKQVSFDGMSTPSPDFQPNPDHLTWTTMTPQEISLWIDRQARIVFPCAFLLFNIFYWTFINLD